MASIGELIKNDVLAKENIYATALTETTRVRAKEQFGIQIAESNQALVEFADIVVLAVKPQYYQTVIEEVRGAVREDQLLIRIAPGKTMEWLGDDADLDITGKIFGGIGE